MHYIVNLMSMCYNILINLFLRGDFMQKGVVYMAIILAIIVIFCAISSSGIKKSSNQSVVTNAISNIEIQDKQVTTNIWDYIHNQQEKNTTLGQSDGDAEVSSNDTQSDLTIIVE